VELRAAGWGRYFDNTCKGMDAHAGVALGERAAAGDWQGEKVQPLSFERPGDISLHRARCRFLHRAEQRTKKSAEPKAGRPTPASQLDFLHRTAMDAQLSSDAILRMTPHLRPGGGIPVRWSFGHRPGARSAAMIKRRAARPRVYYLSLGSARSTRTRQERATHDRLMQATLRGPSSASGRICRPRRMMIGVDGDDLQRVWAGGVDQNASGGTDHGAAAPMFFLFGEVDQGGGLSESNPSLKDLDQGRFEARD